MQGSSNHERAIRERYADLARGAARRHRTRAVRRDAGGPTLGSWFVSLWRRVTRKAQSPDRSRGDRRPGAGPQAGRPAEPPSWTSFADDG